MQKSFLSKELTFELFSSGPVFKDEANKNFKSPGKIYARVRVNSSRVCTSRVTVDTTQTCCLKSLPFTTSYLSQHRHRPMKILQAPLPLQYLEIHCEATRKTKVLANPRWNKSGCWKKPFDFWQTMEVFSTSRKQRCIGYEIESEQFTTLSI